MPPILGVRAVGMFCILKLSPTSNGGFEAGQSLEIAGFFLVRTDCAVKNSDFDYHVEKYAIRPFLAGLAASRA